MKHLLVLAAFVAISAASVIPKAERPERCMREWDADGQCMTTRTTWTYDLSTNTCVEVEKFGCLGSNNNVFETEDECLAICAVDEDNALKTLPSDVRLDLLNFNDFMDSVLGTISSAMKTIGADPIEVDGFVIDQIPNLRLGFQNGSLSGLSNIVRVGDWGFDMNSVVKYSVHGGVGVHDVNGKFTAIGELSGHGGEVTVTTAMNKFDVTFSFYVDIGHCTIGLDKFTLGDGLELDIDIDTGSFLDPVKSEAISYATNYLITTFDETVEKATLLALGSVNVCELVASFVAAG